MSGITVNVVNAKQEARLPWPGGPISPSPAKSNTLSTGVGAQTGAFATIGTDQG